MQRIAICTSLAALLLLGFFAATPAATADEKLPSAKATARVGDIAVVEGPVTSGESQGEWQTVMSTRIRTPNKKSLFMQVSLECGLYTSTTSKSRGGNKDTSSAEAAVHVRVLVDGVPARPGPVVFARRVQELSATLQGLLDGCLTVDPDTGAVLLDEECLEPEEVEMILRTMNANSFGFVQEELSAGVHQIEVQARIDLGADADGGSAEARATIGVGSVTVQEVRLLRGEDVEDL